MVMAIISLFMIILILGLIFMIIDGDKEIEQLKNKLYKQNVERTTECIHFTGLKNGCIHEIEHLKKQISELQELNNISTKEFENLTLKQKRYILTAIKKVGLPFCKTEDIRAWNVLKPNNRIVKITMNERGFIHLIDEEGKEHDPDKIITKKEEYVEFLENELNNIKK